MIVLSPLLVPLGSPHGNHLGYQQDDHILSSRDAAGSVPRRAPLPRDAYISVAHCIVHEARRGDPRQHLRVNSRDNSRDVPCRLPNTPSCTERDDVAITTTYRTTSFSDSERAQKSDLDSVSTAYCAMLNIAILTPVGDALFPSSFESSARAATYT